MSSTGYMPVIPDIGYDVINLSPQVVETQNMNHEDRDAESDEDQDLDLNLSCSSSEYNLSEQEESESERTERNVLDIHPYQFEPYADSSSESESEINDHQVDNDQERLQNTAWCTCNNCIIMPSLVECQCCLENAKAIEKMDEYNSRGLIEVKCITEHPGFQTVCLDEFFLDAAYNHYKQQYGQQIQNPNERYRYTAYRQFVRWIWGILGKEIRVVIPACVVTRIRQEYPDNDNNYKGFQVSY